MSVVIISSVSPEMINTMKTLFPFLNHRLTAEQKERAESALGATRIVELPAALSARWSAVPPETAELLPWMQPFFDWLTENAKKGDYVLIQGEFGAVYLLVRFSLDRGCIPIHATTARQAIETHLDDGSIHMEHVFKFVRFRAYGQ